MSTPSLHHRHLRYAIALLLVAVTVVATGCTNVLSTTDHQAPVLTGPLPQLRIVEPPNDRPRYRRDDWLPHGWRDADGNGCNTRKEVLIVESSRPLQIGNDCRITTGVWHDRFSAKTATSATDLQIDHLVSLSDAHRSGGWEWSAEKKLAFANDLDDPSELNAITNKVNQEKSDYGPDRWSPDGRTERCLYIRDYVAIKAKWNLSVDKEQWGAILKGWSSCST